MQNKQINVYIQTTPWFISKHRTDWLSRRQMMRLSERFPQVVLHLPQSWMAGIQPNYRYVADLLKWRFLRKKRGEALIATSVGQPLWKPDIQKVAPDVILSSAVFPSNPRGIPVLFETFLTDPGAWLFDITDGDEIAWETRKRLFADFACRAAVIGLRGKYSVGLAKSLFPSFAPKIRDLPFYLPDLEPVVESEVIRKHKDDRVLRILFVGRMARLKGLPEIIGALSQVNRIFAGKIELKIISRFDDGDVALPSEQWISVRNEISWQVTQREMRDSHILIMPSWRESYGLVYLEGMASGNVVFARDREPQSELVDYGRSGILIDPRKVDDMRDKVIRMLTDREYRIRLACQGSKRFQEKYHWSVAGPLWVEAFEYAAGAIRS